MDGSIFTKQTNSNTEYTTQGRLRLGMKRVYTIDKQTNTEEFESIPSASFRKQKLGKRRTEIKDNSPPLELIKKVKMQTKKFYLPLGIPRFSSPTIFQIRCYGAGFGIEMNFWWRNVIPSTCMWHGRHAMRTKRRVEEYHHTINQNTPFMSAL